MSPSADSASPAMPHMLAPAKLMDDGEIVLLAVKPSGWYVLLTSLPVLLTAAVVICLIELIGRAGYYRSALLVCLAVACLRVLVACFQWMGVLYILTDCRVIRLRGMVRADVTMCPLSKIDDVALAKTFMESRLGIGSLHFETDGNLGRQMHWVNVAGPAEVKQAIVEAIKRAG